MIIIIYINIKIKIFFHKKTATLKHYMNIPVACYLTMYREILGLYASSWKKLELSIKIVFFKS